jgi:hypothetical protein
MEQRDGASILEAAEDKFRLALALGFLINTRECRGQRDKQQGCHRHDNQQRVSGAWSCRTPLLGACAAAWFAAPLDLIAAV